MTGSVTRLVRYPIKSLGREDVRTVTLTKGQTMPWDRTWAVMHELAKTDGRDWARCQNFLRVASSPNLAAVKARMHEGEKMLTLSHPDRDDLIVDPDATPDAIIDWVAPLVAEGRAAPSGIARADRGMTDTSTPTVSIANMASHRAVSQKAGQDLSIYRWRSNIWIDGLAPWEEFDWAGKSIRIGTVELAVEHPIERCLNILANPETGHRDVDLLAVLDTWGHQNFSMAATVTKAGNIKIGDEVLVQ